MNTPRRIRRRLILGDETSSPKRISIDVLEALVRQLRETVAVVTHDLGLGKADLTTVELVDLEGGSTGLVWEQETFVSGIPAPLALVLEGVGARSKGRSHRAILTDTARRSIDDLAALCASYTSQGLPIRVEAEPDTAGVGEGEDLKECLVLVEGQLGTREEGPPPQLTESAAPQPDEAKAEWLLRFTGDVQRLDRDRKLWLRIGGLILPVRPKLSEELFSAVDSEDARWKRVEVIATASGTTVNDITEVLHLVPSVQTLDVEVTPTNDAASTIQPVLERVDRLLNLEAGWDSYNATAIEPSAIKAARTFLVLAAAEAKARGWNLQLPFVVPVATGAVQLEWERERATRFLELEFTSRGIAYSRGADGDIVEGEMTRGKALDLVTWFHHGGPS